MIKQLSPGAIKQQFMQYVWGSHSNQADSTMIASLRVTHMVIRDLMGGMLTLRAMGLVYTTILALVPLLAVSFSVLKGFGIHNDLTPMLINLLAPLGEKSYEITGKIIVFVENTKTGVLGSIGLVILIYTVVSLLQQIEQSFNFTWRVSQHRSIVQRFSNYITIVLVGPVLLISALGVTASVTNLAAIQEAMQIESIGLLLTTIGHLLPYLLVIATFTFVYMLVPNVKVQFKSALVGAVVSGILWETSSWIFASFIAGSTNYTAIYSAFASLIIFFIWLYLDWLILLVGCSIVFYHQNPEQRHLRPKQTELSNRVKESIALSIMKLVAQNFQQQKSAWSISDLASQLGITLEVCSRIVNQLKQQGLLTETSEQGYLPSYDVDTMTLADILSAVRSAEEKKDLGLDEINTETEIDKLQQEIDQAINTSLSKKCIKDIGK